MLTKVMLLYYRRYLRNIASEFFRTNFKLAVLNAKFVNVVELFVQHVSSLCIDCSKMNKLVGVSINVYKLLLSGGKF